MDTAIGKMTTQTPAIQEMPGPGVTAGGDGGRRGAAGGWLKQAGPLR